MFSKPFERSFARVLNFPVPNVKMDAPVDQKPKPICAFAQQTAPPTNPFAQLASPPSGGAAQVCAFLDGPADGHKEFDDVWRFYADPGEATPTVHSAEALRLKLGLDPDWHGAASLKALIDYLEQQGLTSSRLLSDLTRLGQRSSRWNLNAVSRQIKAFHEQHQVASGLNRDEILRNVIHDVAWPSDIAQRSYSTCTAAALQMKLALERPAQYVTILTTLAQGKNYTTPGGAVMKPNSTWRNDSKENRTQSARIVQNAIMNLGGQGLIWDDTYNSANDDDENGLNWGEQTYALEQLFGNDDYDNDGLLSSAASLYQYVEDEIARGRSAIVSFPEHAVLVVGIDKTGAQPKVILNSWGRQFEMTRDEFEDYVKAARTLDDSGSDNHRVAAGTRKIIGA